MNPPYLLAQGSGTTRLPLRFHSTLPRLKLADSATRAMIDFQRDPPLTVDESYSLEEAIDRMFRLGVRAFLVVRDLSVVGLMTASEATRSTPQHSRVADAMTPTDDVPAIDWHTLAESRVRDLVEIFDATGVNYLVVLESHSASLSSVRGLIQHKRLQRQLSSPWSLRAAGI
ncbi:MAG TPA: CBS domain-containing protein [Steroidobacteraceae bacterium]|nr:CBS domain-containing protein [Steroidobacteraceae bacterium]